MPQSPRDYQTRALSELRANFAAGVRRQLLVAPTGAGKTTIAAILIDGATRKSRRTWFLAHRKELIGQCSRRLDEQGVDHGIIQADHPRFRPRLPVQVVSVASARSRLGKMDAPDLIIIDEAHRAMAKSYERVCEHFADAATIGLTATPWRLDGRPLGNRFQKLVLVARPHELIEQGWLLAPTIYAPTLPDLSSLKISAGDYAQDEAAEKMGRAEILGDIVEHWMRLVVRGSTVVFGVNKAHSIAIRDKFRAAGVPAHHIDDETPGREREEILSKLADGSIQVVTNCAILTEGWDLPSLRAVVLARPTKSVALFLQMVGRGMRPAPGKDSWILLDHAGCVLEHGFPDEDRDYSLTERAGRERKKNDEGPPVTVCEKCFAAYRAQKRQCPVCGFERKIDGRKIQTADGELQELTRDGMKKIREKFTPRSPETWANETRRLTELYQAASLKGHKPTWACFKFKDETGRWPPMKMQIQAKGRLRDGSTIDR